MTPASLPDAGGHFGPYGGRYVPEVLMAPIEELEQAYLAARAGSGVPGRTQRSAAELRRTPHPAVLRQPPDRTPGRRAHLDQARGPAAHRRAQDQQQPGPGTARASAWARSASSPKPARASTAWPPPRSARCSASSASSIWARKTCARQRLNVFRMRLLGAKVVGVSAGSRTLKDAISEAMRDWVTNVADTYYLLGSALGPHPYPDDGARFSEGDRGRGAPPDSGSRRPTARIWCWPAWAAARTPSASFMRSVPDARSRWSASRPAARVRNWASTPRVSTADRRACCTGRTAMCCRMTTARSRSRIPFRRAWITR